jgi:hypothetical protein
VTKDMSEGEFFRWCGLTREQACSMMINHACSPLPARAMADGAKMSVSEPACIWTENFQKPLCGMWKSSAVYCSTYGDIDNDVREEK